MHIIKPPSNMQKISIHLYRRMASRKICYLFKEDKRIYKEKTED